MNQSADDVLREALYLLVERDKFWHNNKQELDAKIYIAMGEMARGEGITESQLLEHIAKRKKAFFAS